MIIEAGVRESSKNGTVLLWNAERIGAATGPFEVDLDLSPYKVLYISLVHSTDVPDTMTTMILNDHTMVAQPLFSINHLTEVGRSVTITSTGLSFTNGFERQYTSDGTTFAVNIPTVAIPARIYGGY